jgi:hypothetical protein
MSSSSEIFEIFKQVLISKESTNTRGLFTHQILKYYFAIRCDLGRNNPVQKVLVLFGAKKLFLNGIAHFRQQWRKTAVLS